MCKGYKNGARVLVFWCAVVVLATCICSCRADKTRAQEASSEGASRGEPNARPMIIWHYHSIRDKPETLELALSSGLITHVMLGGTLHRKDRDFRRQTNALAALKVAKAFGVKIIWARPLWPLYAIQDSSAEDIFDRDYYVREIRMVRAEARQVGADYTALDSEAYGYSPTKKYLRGRNKLTAGQLARLKQVIAEVVQAVGKVDFALPAGVVQRPRQPSRYIAQIGRYRVSETTYYDNEKLMAKIDYPYEIFGAYLDIQKKNEKFPTLPFYLVPEIFEKSERWSRCKGLFLYSREHHAHAVAQQLVAYARTLPSVKTGRKRNQE